MIRRLIMVFAVVVFAVAASISSPSSVNAAGFLERFQGTQQSNQKVQDQYPKQAKYPSQEQYAQDQQLPQAQQIDQGKDGQHNYFKDQLNQLDAKSSRQTTPGQPKPGTASD